MLICVPNNYFKNSSNCSSVGIPSYYKFNEFFKNFAEKKTLQIATGISPKLDFVTYLLAYLVTYLPVYVRISK